LNGVETPTTYEVRSIADGCGIRLDKSLAVITIRDKLQTLRDAEFGVSLLACGQT
jgi:hypothetical protein